eukprot:g3060.t1
MRTDVAIRALAARAKRPLARLMSASANSNIAGQPPPAEKEKLVIFDTTLRDGEQSPGATLSLEEKLTIARHLCSMGVDVCEAGFPIASPGDFDAVTAIARTVGPMTDGRPSGEPMVIAGLARANRADIERCFEAVRHAPRHRIHTFIASSDLHLEHKLKISRAECIQQAVSAITLARELCADVEFSPEDAGRSDPDFLVDLLCEAVRAGATTINIPDTVGYTLPNEYGALIGSLIAEVGLRAPTGESVRFSTHCHDDLGLATANSLAGVHAGARQVEVAVNGIGERAGNTSLEEIVMALRTRPACFPVYCNVDPTGITRASQMVSRFTGIVVQPNKAIVGNNAFAHESGIHQDGMLKNRATYEIITPQDVGLNQSSLVLGKHSGRAAYRDRLEALGYTLYQAELDDVVRKCKVVADTKKEVTDDDIEAIVADVLFKPSSATWKLTALHVTAGNLVKPTATVTIVRDDGKEVSHASVGTGPIDAVYQAVAQATGVRCKLQDFAIQSIRQGATKALGVVTVKVSPAAPRGSGGSGSGGGGSSGGGGGGGPALVQGSATAGGGGGRQQRMQTICVDGVGTSGHGKVHAQTGELMHREYAGRGTSTDIIEASAKAYINALNRMLETEAAGSNASFVGSLGGGTLLPSSLDEPTTVLEDAL